MDSVIAAATQKLADQGLAFGMFVVIVYFLIKAVRILYDRTQYMADNFVKALVDNTAALNNLANKIENSNDR